MPREVTFDQLNDRLVFLSRSPEVDYWEELWEPALTAKKISFGDKFVVGESKRVLPRGAKVIDAGCGIGATVHGLRSAGFDAYGVDFAENTVASTKQLFPELNVQVADVKSMPFEDGFFDGVWSLGVIEHFYDGFNEIIAESKRVLRTGGYLFLTVPVISPFKKFKIRRGEYRPYDSAESSRFFQFAFHSNQVTKNICGAGFNLLSTVGRSAAFGLYEDLGQQKLRILPSPENEAFWARAWWRLADRALRPISHHTRYFLFQKKG